MIHINFLIQNCFFRVGSQFRTWLCSKTRRCFHINDSFMLDPSHALSQRPPGLERVTQVVLVTRGCSSAGEYFCFLTQIIPIFLKTIKGNHCGRSHKFHLSHKDAVWPVRSLIVSYHTLQLTIFLYILLQETTLF